MPAANTTYRRLIGKMYDSGLELEAYKPKSQSSASGGYKYAKPPGWTKPSEYTGLKGSLHKEAISKGYLNLGLVNPDLAGEDAKLSAQVFRNLVRLLIQGEGKTEISDPEWVLKRIYPGSLIVKVLAEDIQDALETIFDSAVPVSIKLGTHAVLGGFGWLLTAPSLKSLVKKK